MDCQMPVMDGDVVTRELRRNQDLYMVPTVIVAVTADASEEHRAKCIEAGMDDFVTKPIRLDGLRSGLARWTVAADHRSVAEENSSVAIVRDELMAKTAQTDEVFLREYIQLFLIDTNVRLRILADAVDAADSKVILREGHSLKGACLEFGAERMARYCEALMSAVKSGDRDETASVMQKLGNEFSRIRPVFDSVRSSLH
jgi:response regulator RpfG family c-di-GMP phosphodiesterase